jgi:hypothetical protein
MRDESVFRHEGGFSHWVIFNIPEHWRTLIAGIDKVPEPFGRHGPEQGQNGNGEDGYLGPNPTLPPPMHDYIFRLYALNTRLTLPPTVTAGELRNALGPHIVTDGRATLVGTFQLPPAPTPPPTPPPVSRSASLITKRVGKGRNKKRVLFVHITASDGSAPRDVRSPFQKPAFKNIQVKSVSANEVVLTAKKGKKTVTKTVPA